MSFGLFISAGTIALLKAERITNATVAKQNAFGM
jgi:hypothetical protein